MPCDFPFLRGSHHQVGELRTFESSLKERRQADAALSRQLRTPSGSAAVWMRLRNRELVPLLLLANQLHAKDDDVFSISEEGSVVDATLFSGSKLLRLQITVTAPLFGTRGYQFHETLAALNRADCVVGHAPFEFANGVATGDHSVLSNEERDLACLNGLKTALRKKQRHRGNGISLAVFAQEFYFHLIELGELQRIANDALEAHPLTFDRLFVFDSQPGFFIQKHL